MASESKLQVVIDADDRASGKLRSLGSQVGTIGTKLAQFGAVGVAAVAGFSVMAIKSASDMQNLRVNMDVLTGSAEEGAKIFKELNKFAAKTPFETKDLAAATQTMLGFGIANTKVMGNLKMLGDISLGNKEKLAGISLAFSQITSTGRLMGQDLLQLINNGFNPLTIISQKTGKSMAELKKEMEKGAITSGMVEDAFKTATEKGGLFFDGMDKGSRTFSGVMSTMKDNLGMVMRAVVGLSDTGEVVKGGLFDKVSMAVQNLIPWLERNKDTIVNVASAFVQNLLSAIEKVAVFVAGTVIPAFQRFGEFMNTVVIPAIRDQLAPAWDRAYEAIKPHIPLLLELLKYIGIVVGLTIIGGIIALGRAFAFVVEQTGHLISGVRGVIDFIRQGAGRTFIDDVADQIRSVINWFQNAINKIQEFKDKTGGVISNTTQNVGDFFRGLFKAKGGSVTGNQPYIVGEKGAELFVPSQSGTIIPNNKLSGGTTVNFNNVSVRSDNDLQTIIAEVKRVLTRESNLERLRV